MKTTAVTVSDKTINTWDIKSIIVQDDIGVDTLTFTMPKLYGTLDLSTGIMYCRYELPDGTGDQDILTVTTSGDNLTAAWAMSDGAASYSGALKIQLEGIVGTKVWHTDQATIQVSATLDPSSLAFTPQVLDAHLILVQALVDEAEAFATSAEESKDAILDDAGFIAVAADLAGANTIGTVAGNISEVVIVAADLALGESSLIKQVADNKTNIDLVAGSVEEIDLLTPCLSDITTVADDINLGVASTIGIVAGSISDVQTVAGDIVAVAQVASDTVAINAVNDNKTNIDAVAGNATNINAVNANKTNIDAVAGNSVNINAVNANKANIDTVAGISANVTTVAGISTQVTALALLVDEITALDAIKTDITAVALVDDAVSALALLTTQLTALGARTTEIDAIYAEIDQIAAKLNLSAVKASLSATPLDTNVLSEKYVDTRFSVAENNITDHHLQSIKKDAQQDTQIVSLQKSSEISAQALFASAITRYASVYTLGVDSAGSVIAVPVAGTVSLIMYGRTYTNIAPTTLATALDGWTSDYDSIVSSKYRLTHTSDATGERSIATLLDVTKYYLIACLGKSASDTAGAKFDILEDTGGAVIVTSSLLTATLTSRIGAIIQPSEMTGHTPHLLMTHKGSGYAEFSEFTVVEITSTEYALGLAQMLEKYPFITGTKSTGPMRYRVVGKNKCPTLAVAWEQGSIDSSTGADATSTSTIRTPAYYPCLASETVSLSQVGTGFALTALFYDSAKTYISAVAGANQAVPANARYVRYKLGHATTATVPADVKTLLPQYESGASATAWMAFEQSSISDPYVKRSVPAITDRFFRSGGGWWNEGNVSEILTIHLATTWAVDQEAINTIRFYKSFSVFASYVGGITKYTGKIGTTILPALVSTASTNDVEGFLINNGSFYMRILKSRLSGILTSDLETWMQAQGSSQFLYQSITPVLTSVPGPDVLGFANSTAYVEKWYEEVLECTVAGQITTTYYPSTIELIKAYDGGYEWTVVADSITNKVVAISEAFVGYAYKIGYYYSDESTIARTDATPTVQNLVTKIDSLITPSITNTVVGYEAIVDVANGGTTVLPASGTFRWEVRGYGANIGGAKRGTAAGGATLTMAGANAEVWYRRLT